MAWNDLKKNTWKCTQEESLAEGLFKAIVILEQEEDTEKVVATLKKRLEKHLESFSVAKGSVFKNIGSLKYHPNGLIEVKGMSYRTLLSGYEFELPEGKIQAKKPSATPPYIELKKISMLWYWQVMQAAGKQFKLSASFDIESYQKSVQFLEKYDNLNSKEKSFLQSQYHRHQDVVTEFLIKTIMPEYCRYRREYDNGEFNYGESNIMWWTDRIFNFSFLTPEEIEGILTFYKKASSKQGLFDSLLDFAERKYKNPEDKGAVYQEGSPVVKRNQSTYRSMEEKREFQMEALKRVPKGPVYDLLVSLGFIFGNMIQEEETEDIEDVANS